MRRRNFLSDSASNVVGGGPGDEATDRGKHNGEPRHQAAIRFSWIGFRVQNPYDHRRRIHRSYDLRRIGMCAAGSGGARAVLEQSVWRLLRPVASCRRQFHALRADRIRFVVVPELLPGVLGRRWSAVPDGLSVRHTLLGKADIDVHRDGFLRILFEHEYRWAGIIFSPNGL